MRRASVLLAFLLLLPAFLPADAGAWVSFDIPAAEEEGALAALSGRGIDAIAWSNAVAEVSDFGPLRLLPVKDLDRVLTDQDPRRDPWLTGIGSSFHPREGAARLWVLSEKRDAASEALGALVQDSGHAAEVAGRPAASPGHGDESLFTPRQITAWTVLLASLLLLILRLAAALLDGGLPGIRRGWRALLLPLAGLAAAVVVLALPAGAVRAAVREAPKAPAAEVSWLRHRWFQESYPWGAGWNDWTPGKPWSYPSFERRDGKVAAVRTTLPVPDQAWADAAYASLDPHHAARIFPRENP